MSKDTIKVNMNVYDIPILVEQLKKLEKENKQLKEEIENIKDFNNKLQASKDRLDKDDYNLAHILTELEEWTKSEYDRYYNDKENLVFSNVEVIDFGRVLNKIQELKEKYK